MVFMPLKNCSAAWLLLLGAWVPWSGCAPLPVALAGEQLPALKQAPRDLPNWGAVWREVHSGIPHFGW